MAESQKAKAEGRLGRQLLGGLERDGARPRLEGREFEVVEAVDGELKR
jgi:hypothetical protein